MKKDYISACMNPIRQRILQFLVLHGTASTSEILESLGDVPRASLYRHMKCLLEAGAIEVQREEKQRGAKEKYYRIVPPDYKDNTPEETSAMIQTAIMGIASSFSEYFSKDDADPYRDLLTISVTNLLLNDQDYIALLEKMGQLIKEAMENPSQEGQKSRALYLLSVPTQN